MKKSNLSLKRLAILIVICIYFPSLALAQQRERGTIEIAPYAGYASVFINGSDIRDLGTRNVIRFGIHGDFYFNDRWSIRSGLNYESLGASTLFDGDYAFNYLNIPVNANWHFGSTRKWNLNFGLTPGFLLNAEREDTDIKQVVAFFQLAITYGIGYRIELSNKVGILIDWQGLVGITDIAKNSVESTALNASGSFNVGVVFAL